MPFAAPYSLLSRQKDSQLLRTIAIYLSFSSPLFTTCTYFFWNVLAFHTVSFSGKHSAITAISKNNLQQRRLPLSSGNSCIYFSNTWKYSPCISLVWLIFSLPNYTFFIMFIFFPVTRPNSCIFSFDISFSRFYCGPFSFPSFFFLRRNKFKFTGYPRQNYQAFLGRSFLVFPQPPRLSESSASLTR